MLLIVKVSSPRLHRTLKNLLKFKTRVVLDLDYVLRTFKKSTTSLRKSVTIDKRIYKFILNVEDAFIENIRIFVPFFIESLIEKTPHLFIK